MFARNTLIAFVFAITAAVGGLHNEPGLLWLVMTFFLNIITVPVYVILKLFF